MSERVYQLKISLNGSQPLIWRQIQVPSSYNFRQLHLAIQKAMGWKSVLFDYHLHKFEIMNPDTFVEDAVMMADDLACYQDFRGDGDVKDENDTKIAEYFKVPGDVARYEYDFGIGWDHQVLLEKILPLVAGEKYPKCVAGARACPPEDGRASSDEEEGDSDEFDKDKCFADEAEAPPQQAAGGDNN